MGLDNPVHIAFLLILLLLVFGAKRLPEMGRSLGSGMRDFKDSLSGESRPTLSAQQPEAAPGPTNRASGAPVAVAAVGKTHMQPAGYGPGRGPAASARDHGSLGGVAR